MNRLFSLISKTILVAGLLSFGSHASLLGNINDGNFGMEVLMQDFTKPGEVLVDIGFDRGDGRAHERHTMFLLDSKDYNAIFNTSEEVKLRITDNMSEQTFVKAVGNLDNRKITFNVQSNPGVNFLIKIELIDGSADVYMEMYRKGWIFNSTRSENIATNVSFNRNGINMYNIDNECVGNVKTMSALTKAASVKTEENFKKYSNNKCH